MRNGVLWTAMLGAALSGCTTLDEVPLDAVGEARLSFADGRPAGTARLLNDARGLRIVVSATGMTPGARVPCLRLSGLRWPPAEVKPGALHSPVAWR